MLEGLTVMQLARKVKDDTQLFVYLAAMSSTTPFASTPLALHWHSTGTPLALASRSDKRVQSRAVSQVGADVEDVYHLNAVRTPLQLWSSIDSEYDSNFHSNTAGHSNGSGSSRPQR